MTDLRKYRFRMLGFETNDRMKLERVLLDCCKEFNRMYAEAGLQIDFSEEIECVLTDLSRNGDNTRLPLAYAIDDGDGEIAAVALIVDGCDLKNAVTVAYVYVTPRHRRRGVGTMLVQRVLREAGMRFPKCRVVFNCVLLNQAARRLYAKIGLLSRPFETWYDITDTARTLAQGTGNAD